MENKISKEKLDLEISNIITNSITFPNSYTCKLITIYGYDFYLNQRYRSIFYDLEIVYENTINYVNIQELIRESMFDYVYISRTHLGRFCDLDKEKISRVILDFLKFQKLKMFK